MITPFPKPHKIAKPRLPARKYMTIIVGMLNQDGLVMAADSEESTSHLKASVQKIYPYTSAKKSFLLIGGAGPGYLIDTITQNLWDDFRDASLTNIREVQIRIADHIREFYEKYVLRWPSREEREDNDFSLLLGCSVRIGDSDRYQNFLWVAEKGILRTAIPSWAVGMGETYARTLMNGMYGVYPISGNVLIAIDTVRKVKQDTPYCGKETRLWYVTGGKLSSISPPHVERAEDLLRSLERTSMQNFFQTAILHGSDYETLMNDTVALQAEFRLLIREMGI